MQVLSLKKLILKIQNQFMKYISFLFLETNIQSKNHNHGI